MDKLTLTAIAIVGAIALFTAAPASMNNVAILPQAQAANEFCRTYTFPNGVIADSCFDKKEGTVTNTCTPEGTPYCPNSGTNSYDKETIKDFTKTAKSSCKGKDQPASGTCEKRK